jgi:hypothetical protein
MTEDPSRRRLRLTSLSLVDSVATNREAEAEEWHCITWSSSDNVSAWAGTPHVAGTTATATVAAAAVVVVVVVVVVAAAAAVDNEGAACMLSPPSSPRKRPATTVTSVAAASHSRTRCLISGVCLGAAQATASHWRARVSAMGERERCARVPVRLCMCVFVFGVCVCVCVCVSVSVSVSVSV